MMRLFAKYPDQAGLTIVDPDELISVRSEAEWVWVDLSEPSESDVRLLSTAFAIDPLSIQDMLDVTLFPKVDHHADYLFVVLHGVGVEPSDRVGTLELDLVVGRDFLVTAHRSPMVGVEWVAEQASAAHPLALAGPAAAAAAIAEAGGRRYLPLLDALEERIEELEDLALVADPRLLAESQALRRDVIVLRRILGPQRDVLRQLAQSISPLIDDRARREFSDVYDHHFRLVESMDAARALLAAVLDTYRGAVAERTNEVMKVLTVFSAILLPLGLVAGLWGMNFSQIPGSGWQWGFFALLGVMTVFAVGLWGYFARRGFIGGPKLRTIPKAVGLGLVHIGTAPLRAVGGLIDSIARADGRTPPPESQDEPDRP
jgi:magnesium transporter